MAGTVSCVMALGFWRGGGGGFFYSDGVGSFGDEGVSFFHRHPGILHKHLRVFAAARAHIIHDGSPRNR